MSKLFGRDVGVISRHIKNIFRDELEEKSNLQKMQIPNSDILNKNNINFIDNNTLVALTLLIAQSNPKEKSILIDLIMNFLIND